MQFDHFLRTRAITFARVGLALLFIYSGIGIIQTGIAETAAFYESVGVPAAGLVVWLVLVIKIIGGGLFALGKYVRDTGLALMTFTLLTIFFAHTSLADMDLWKNIAIAAGFLAVLAYDVHARDYNKSQAEVRI